jgi:hypothetical protein
MTKKNDPDNKFIKLGNSKYEVDNKLAVDFKETCEALDVSQATVVRHLLWEFVEMSREDRKKKDDRSRASLRAVGGVSG